MEGVSERATSVLLESPVVGAYDVRCRARRSGYGDAEVGGTAQIILPRRGVFVVHRSGATLVVDTTTALVLTADDEYRVSHPADCGDDCTVLVLPPDVLEDALGGVGGLVARLEARDHFAICVVTALLRDERVDDLEREEATLLLLARLTSAFSDGGRTAVRLGPAQHLRIERVRAMLASAPTAQWNLGAVARAVQCSPFHLARQFRAHTGETVARYLLRLRLGLAVERLAGGERNLAALALETGFANHSHFSARFGSVFGMTPSAARRAARGRQLDELRRFVEPADAG
jgi:AraC family transcriptional regulator